MLTAKEIRDVMFTTVKNKYSAGEVDAFLDECAVTITELTRVLSAAAREKDELVAANENLERKLEVLAEKLVEYRSDEDSLRSALLNAQRLGDTIVRESNHKAELILADANIKAEKIVKNADRKIADERRKLAEMQAEVDDFKSRMLSMYREHIALINLIPEFAGNKEENDVSDDSDTEAAITDDTTAKQPGFDDIIEYASVTDADASDTTDITDTMEEASKNTVEPIVEIVNEPVFADASTVTAPISRFDDLKFGDNYDIDNDDEDSPRRRSW